MRKVLVVDDESSIVTLLKYNLEEAGFEVITANDGLEGLNKALEEKPDVILLDWMLPHMDGMEVCKELRIKKVQIPIIMLTAKDEEFDKVLGLELGADDYMTKPFEIKELLARVQVQLRMSSVMAANIAGGTNAGGLGADGSITGNAVKQTLDYKELSLDLNGKSLDVNGNQVSLTAQEYKIMELFLKNPGKVFSKNEIYEYAWDDYYMGEDKTIYVHISNIRQKMKKYTENEYIETVWGLGFKL